MKRRIQFQTLLLGLLILAILTSGCSAYKKLPFFSTATPYPTNTPYPTTTPYPTATAYPTLTPFPTFTPYPTFTPPPTQVPVMYNWDVKVLSVTKSLTFGTWYYDTSQNSEFIIMTIEYTNKGQETITFYPMSVVLVFPENSTFPGASLAASLYQPEGSTIVRSFDNDGPVISYISPGQTKTDQFAWAVAALTDNHYKLLFPGMDPIDLTAN
jgi:hypothetical protein